MSTVDPATSTDRGPVVTTTRPARRTGPLRRTWALARAEVLLLRRNRTLLFNAVLTPVGVVALLALVGDGRAMTGEVAARSVGLMIAMLLLFVVYYNVLSTAVARREAGVLQRLRTGELADAEVLAAVCAPAVALTLAQTLLLVAIGGPVLDLPLPANPLVVVLGVLLGCAVLALLALATATWSKNLESVQVTSLPVIALCVLGAGVAVPLDLLPEPVQRVAEFLPLTPVVELVQDGWVGEPDLAGVAVPAAIALGWVVAGALVVRGAFRWSPRA
ncbi:ABC transporter permease [Kineococcus terrestris]|uniref:ABC transporter permease n=1 Tax=Kineococcus terrestris TaxID=2044856 RepID=UPI0034DAD85F